MNFYIFNKSHILTKLQITYLYLSITKIKIKIKPNKYFYLNQETYQIHIEIKKFQIQYHNLLFLCKYGQDNTPFYNVLRHKVFPQEDGLAV